MSLRPSNPPGLSAIQYRIGNFTSFRRAMLDQVARTDLLPRIPNPFARWREGSDSDYQTMFIELWAYLADILTFYQERLANEAYLPTATQLDSMARLAALIGYVPSPGSGATGTVALTVAKGQTVVVPAGLRVGTKAKPAANGQAPKAAAVFETSSALVAFDEHNAIPLSPVAPTNQFARLSSFGTFFGKVVVEPSVVATIANDLYGEAAPIFASTFPALSLASSFSSASIETVAFADPIRTSGIITTSPLVQSAASPIQQATATPLVQRQSALARIAAPALNASISAQPSSSIAFRSNQQFQQATFVNSGLFEIVDNNISVLLHQPPIEPGFSYNPFTNNTTRTIVFRGVNTKVKAGDQLLAVENEGNADTEVTTLHQVISVTADKASNTTTIQWVEDPNHLYDVSANDVAVYAFSIKAGVFGNTAPEWDTLSPTLIDKLADGKTDAPLKNKDWDDPANEWFRLPKPEEASKSQVFLDGVYDDAQGTPQIPGWAVLMTDARPDAFIAHVVDVRAVSRSAYASTAKITRLTFNSDEAIPIGPPPFPVRTTLVLAGNQKLTLQDNLPLPEQVSGDVIILTGVHKQLQPGQQVILRGPLFAGSGSTAAPVANSELRTIKGAPNPSEKFGITTVTLDRPLDKSYTRTGSALLANIVEVTQGEQVKDEVLGSGNGREAQSFVLKKSPLTYLPSTDPNSFSAVESTLIVTVNGVRWREVPSLLESPADDQAFTAVTDSQGHTTITFGDGFHGARPPSGVDNIHERYRKGLGTSGNVDVGGVQQLVDNLAGLQKVTNPQATGGGADAENVSGIRQNAPNSVRAFGRAVSAEDYAGLALSFPGVAKASSVWVTRDENLQPVIHPFVQLTIAAENQLPLSSQQAFAAKLRRFLDQRRDPNVALRIVDFTPVFLDVAVVVDIDDRFPRQATLARAQAALSPLPNADGSLGFFAFDNLAFGQGIHLSAIYAALLAVPGIKDANVTTLHRADSAVGLADNVQDTIFIRPTEIAAIGTDPSVAGQGSLVVNLGQGGFADQ